MLGIEFLLKWQFGLFFINIIQFNEIKFIVDTQYKYNGELYYGWDLDHIIPSSSAITENDILKLNHYTNFQPLDSFINRFVKKDRLDYEKS